MRRAKDQSWNDLNIAESSSKDKLAALNFLSGKAAGVSLPHEILIDDMSVSDPIQILNQCSNHFFPKESESLPIHKDLEQEMEHIDHDPCVFEGHRLQTGSCSLR